MPARYALMLLGAMGCTPVLTSPEPALNTDWEAPENTWAFNTPPADLAGEGFHEGETVPDMRFFDQHGDEVSIWQFYGLVVVVDVSTMWCAPCAKLADEVDAVWTDYEDDGFIYLTLLPENGLAEPPSVEDLNKWGSDHSITAPILADHDGWSYQIVTDAAYPRVMVLDRDLAVSVARVDPADDTTIRAAIEAEL